MNYLLDEEVKRTLWAYFQCNFNETAASHLLYVHRNTVTYRLRQIQKHTGLNPFHFYDAIKIVQYYDSMGYDIRENKKKKGVE